MISNKIDIPLRKTKEHDNDEGFEETQSLMSESPSQGASSSGNYEPIDQAQIVVADFSKTKPQRGISTESKTTENSTTTCDHIIPKRQIRSNGTREPQKTNRLLDRSTSLRKSSQDSTTRKSVIPRRSDSLKKPEISKPVSIQKSNSRNSIVSSRSSLNSATSVCTVKKLPLRPNTSNNLNKPIQRTPSNKSVNANNLNKNNLKRSSSNSSTVSNRPPRPLQALSFMKPTTASSTKQNSLTNRGSSFRSKN